MRGSRSILMVCCSAALATEVRADPKPTIVDLKEARDKLVVLTNAEGGVYAVDKDEGRVFYGTAKTLYEQVGGGGRSKDGEAWSVSVWAPRLEYPLTAMVMRKKDGTFVNTCKDKADLALTELTGDKAKAILDKATFFTTPYVRRAYMLARDDRGIYYYVDVLAREYGGKGFRLFVGKKGAMKQVDLTDVTSDTGGDIFSTKTGDLRLVRNTDSATAKTTVAWVRGEKRSELIWLDTHMNAPVIYRDLGLYKISSVICGDI